MYRAFLFLLIVAFLAACNKGGKTAEKNPQDSIRKADSLRKLQEANTPMGLIKKTWRFYSWNAAKDGAKMTPAQKQRLATTEENFKKTNVLKFEDKTYTYTFFDTKQNKTTTWQGEWKMTDADKAIILFYKDNGKDNSQTMPFEVSPTELKLKDSNDGTTHIYVPAS